MDVTNKLLPVETALEQMLAELACRAAIMTVPLTAADGLVLAADQQADFDVPGHDNSAMDGYAVNTADLQSDTPTLPVTQTIAAGHPGQALQPGSAARIFTGAQIPAGANAVVIQENTQREGDQISILTVPEVGANIRLAGHDIRTGSRVLPAGQRLRPQDLGLLASLGIAEISVRRPLKVALVNTGDEVIAAGSPLKEGQIYDSNSAVLSALLKRLGLTVQRYGILEDSAEKTRELLTKAAAEADCVVTTGGVSVGDEDHVRQAVEALGALSLWKLAIKPGKPFAFGHIAGTPFFGLPGNPVAVFVTAVTLMRAALLTLQGAAVTHLPRYRVSSGFTWRASPTRQEYLRVQLTQDPQGEPQLQVFADQGSSVMSSVAWADGLAVIPAGKNVSPGDRLDFMPFEGLL